VLSRARSFVSPRLAPILLLSLLALAAFPALSWGQSADDVIGLSVSPNPVTAGANVTYTVTATNNGPDPSTNVVVTNVLPASLTLVSATPTQGTCSGTTTITCSIGSLALYGAASITIVATTTAAGTFTDTASVTQTETDPDTTNNSVSKGSDGKCGRRSKHRHKRFAITRSPRRNAHLHDYVG
jgi:uncharacterized repeat protein (TIGR01451 family)